MKDMYKLLITLAILGVITFLVIILTTQPPENEPTDPFVYYDYDRVHKDSKYSTTDMHDHTGKKIGYYIKFTHEGDIIIVDCLDDNKGTAEENRDSYLYPFKLKETK